MVIIILIGCAVAGVGIYFAIVKPLLVPLTSRIPTGREYRPTFSR